MISVANRLYIDPAHAAAFEQRFLSRPRLVDERPGFISSYLMRPTEPGAPYVVFTLWESRDAFEAWRSSPNFKEGHKGGQTLPAGTQTQANQLEIHEIFSSSHAAGTHLNSAPETP